MNKIIAIGESIQDGIPTPDEPKEILNKYIDLIDKGYCRDCNELNCIDNFPQTKIAHSIKDLQQENNKLKKEKEDLQNELDSANSRDCDLAMRIAKAINLIENGDLLYLASKCSTIYKDNIEIVAIYDRLRELLEILKGEDK